MKKVIILFLFLIGLPLSQSGVAEARPDISENRIVKDLAGRTVDSWKFDKNSLMLVELLDAKYDKDRAVVYVFVHVVKVHIDQRTGQKPEENTGDKLKLRLEYEYAANEWNLFADQKISSESLNLFGSQFLPEIIGNPLFEVVYLGKLDIVKRLITTKETANTRTKNGLSLLSIACGARHIQVAHFLLRKGADVNPSRTGELAVSPLNIASALGDKKLVELLLANKAEIDAWSLLISCSKAEHTEIVKLLLEKGANPNLGVGGGITPLIEASTYPLFRKGFDEIPGFKGFQDDTDYL